MLHTSDFDFELPPELIASHPLERRDASRMLVVNSPLARGVVGETHRGVALSDKHIRDFLDYLQPGDVVVFNNSRVIPARFDAIKSSPLARGVACETRRGVAHEITLHTAVDDKTWWGLCRKFNKIKVGDTLTMTDGTTITVKKKDSESGLLLCFNCDNVFDVLNRVGKMPLPPYMKREAEVADSTRYQTVYADPLGSMAAPTAGLHFTDELMNEIENRGAQIVKITLHVGAGTWMPVKTENLSEHKMHSEWFCITPDQADIINNATRVIAVGTTSLRALESAASSPLARGEAGGTRRGVDYKTLPANQNLKQRARDLRKAGSLPEALLWRAISGKKINGLNFNRQTVIGNYIVDFFCPKTGLVIEIDDKSSHDIKGAYDEKRENFLVSLGLTTLHISAADILKDVSNVVDMISRHPGTSCHPSSQRGTCFGFQTKHSEDAKNSPLSEVAAATSTLSSPLARGVAGETRRGVASLIAPEYDNTVTTEHNSYCDDAQNSPLVARGVAGETRRGVAPRIMPFCGTTDIFITPGYKFRAVDVLLTNFHLPKSTLFMLVSAFSGLEQMKAAYAHAVAEKYRFFSYGDCCLLFRKDSSYD